MTYIPALGKQVQGDGRSSTLAPSLLGAAASWLSSCFCIQAVGGEQAGVPARCGCACGACHKPRFIASSLLALRSDVSGEDGDAGGPALPTHPRASYRSLSASLRVRHALGVRLPPLMSWLPHPPICLCDPGCITPLLEARKRRSSSEGSCSVLAPPPESLVNPNLLSRILFPLFLFYTQGY